MQWDGRARGILCLLVLSALVAKTAAADDGGVDVMGGSAVLMAEQPTISMSDEYVRIDMSSDSFRVRASFHFFNHGASTTVAVGFPVEGLTGANKHDFPYFKTWVNGKVVETHTLPDAADGDGETYSYFKVKEVRFPATSTTTTAVEYTAPYGFSSNGELSIRYQYGTGGSWHGPIGKAVFDIRVDENLLGFDAMIAGFNSLSTGGRLINRSKGQLVFELDNLKPKRWDSLRFSFRQLLLCFHDTPPPDDREYCPWFMAEDSKQWQPPEPAFPSLIYLRLKRNEVYARHGYVFRDPVMKRFFQSRRWYTPDLAYSAPAPEDEKLALSFKAREVAILKEPHYTPPTTGR
ncbi:MAG: YARHG domain-containing protein [Elusimicrobia bacterium]|nr:YARHG domain-containing protein [Elusimicrobiota bacterium]